MTAELIDEHPDFDDPVASPSQAPKDYNNPNEEEQETMTSDSGKTAEYQRRSRHIVARGIFVNWLRRMPLLDS